MKMKNKGLTRFRLNTSKALSIVEDYGMEISLTTLYNWCENYKIGKKIGGRYRISEKRLKLVLEGRSCQLKEALKQLEEKRNQP